MPKNVTVYKRTKILLYLSTGLWKFSSRGRCCNVKKGLFFDKFQDLEH